MAKKGIMSILLERKKVRRKGVHAKTKTSKVKSSKHYKKAYRGQGKKR
jgi:hypothetical protein